MEMKILKKGVLQLKKPEFLENMKKLFLAFPGGVTKEAETWDVWYETVQELDQDKVEKAMKTLLKTTETLRPGTNIGALIRNAVSPIITASTIQTKLYHAIQMNQNNQGDPWAFLKSTDPFLLKLAEGSDLFNKTIDSQAMSYRVNEVSRQYIEATENRKRGFQQKETVPVSRHIENKPAVKPGEMSEANRLAGLEALKKIRHQMGGKEPQNG
jgi:hypothetical protein